jgi:hypothetical protein
VHPFLDTGAHILKGTRFPSPVYHICTHFPPFAPVFYLETVFAMSINCETEIYINKFIACHSFEIVPQKVKQIFT